MTDTVTTEKPIGRNEPCPCGSGKKYKRCCGVNAAPKLTAPKLPEGGAGAGWDPSALSNLDPQMMQQFTQSLQRLPKGQLQRLQVIMQKAMSGKDVSAEAAELEKSLPPDFQQMMQAFSMSAAASMGLAQEPATSTDTSDMTEEKARELVARAAAEGTISKEQAAALLKDFDASKSVVPPAVLPDLSEPGQSEGQVDSSVTPEPLPSENQQNPSKLSKFWKSLSGKKES